MSHNGKEIRKLIKEAGEKKSKPNAFNNDVITDPAGQLKYPGQVTKIPGNKMATHGYGNIPLWTVPDVGDPRMVYPNTGTQVFPGASSFTEYPMSKNNWLDDDEEYKKGGPVNPLQLKRGKRNKTHKNIQSSINELFLRNYNLFGPGGKNIYDPLAKREFGGGWLDNL
jgi:hypothetical protein